MEFTARSEMEYLGSVGRTSDDLSLIRDLSLRLDALRRYDQHFSDADWRPERVIEVARATPGRPQF